MAGDWEKDTLDRLGRKVRMMAMLVMLVLLLILPPLQTNTAQVQRGRGLGDGHAMFSLVQPGTAWYSQV